jgi:hypothetical protein
MMLQQHPFKVENEWRGWGGGGVQKKSHAFL